MSFDYAEICKFLYSEARCLDDKDFDSWLQFYDEDIEFWMPAWDDDGEITKNPRNEISLIYYDHRSGLEDRVFRIQTERSGASSVPEPRTLHSISNIEIIESNDEVCSVRYNWITKSFRYNKINTFFGVTFIDLLKKENKGFLIHRKKVVLKNDYIDQVLDVYHI